MIEEALVFPPGTCGMIEASIGSGGSEIVRSGGSAGSTVCGGTEIVSCRGPMTALPPLSDIRRWYRHKSDRPQRRQPDRRRRFASGTPRSALAAPRRRSARGLANAAALWNMVAVDKGLGRRPLGSDPWPRRFRAPPLSGAYPTTPLLAVGGDDLVAQQAPALARRPGSRPQRKP
jgi:hypothetical protein